MTKHIELVFDRLSVDWTPEEDEAFKELEERINKSPTPEEEAQMWAQLERDPDYLAWKRLEEKKYKKSVDKDELPF